jgi:phosphoribosylanthranilate isomerase
MNIKVCGITNVKQLRQLDGLNIDFAGLNFYPQSPRYAGRSIAKDELQDADFDLKLVGIFVNSEYDHIMKIVEDYSLDIVQLHGDESPYLCEQVSEQVEVIKTFRISDNNEGSIDYRIADFDEACDYYLFDTGGKDQPGGTGEKFDWSVIAAAKIEKPFFLSGGIKPADAALVKKFKHPDFFGIDINSGFEKEPGNKDMAQILQFLQDLKKK